MSNSNYDNFPRQENYRNRSENIKSRSNRDGGGFRIRLSDNEMKAVKAIQETFQLKSTVAVLGFSVRTLSEMIRDETLIKSITKHAKNNKNASSNRQSRTSEENKSRSKPNPDPFARPVKNSSIKDIKSNNDKEDEK